MAQSAPTTTEISQAPDSTIAVNGDVAEKKEGPNDKSDTGHDDPAVHTERKASLLTPGRHIHHRELEAELEIYPFNILIPSEPVVKNEVVIDYHNFSENEKWLGGARFFLVSGTHYKDIRETRSLLMYTEGYFGHRCMQIGGEIGSVTGIEYLSVGPQVTLYDNLVFKRLALISRVYPDLVFGYEFTTQEFRIFKNLKWSATGMCRYLPAPDERIFQFSSWFSFQHIEWLFVGIEYEYNKAPTVSTSHSAIEHPNELYLGVKFELH